MSEPRRGRGQGWDGRGSSCGRGGRGRGRGWRDQEFEQEGPPQLIDILALDEPYHQRRDLSYTGLGILSSASQMFTENIRNPSRLQADATAERLDAYGQVSCRSRNWYLPALQCFNSAPTSPMQPLTVPSTAYEEYRGSCWVTDQLPTAGFWAKAVPSMAYYEYPSSGWVTDKLPTCHWKAEASLAGAEASSTGGAAAAQTKKEPAKAIAVASSSAGHLKKEPVKASAVASSSTAGHSKKEPSKASAVASSSAGHSKKDPAKASAVASSSASHSKKGVKAQLCEHPIGGSDEESEWPGHEAYCARGRGLNFRPILFVPATSLDPPQNLPITKPSCETHKEKGAHPVELKTLPKKEPVKASSAANKQQHDYYRSSGRVPPEPVPSTSRAPAPPTAGVQKDNTGSPLNIKADYFVMKTTPEWVVYEYHVEFSPDETDIYQRKVLLRSHATLIGASRFDGTILYSIKKFSEPLHLFAIRETDRKLIEMVIKFNREVNAGNEHSAEIFQIIIRQCFQFEGMQRMGRDYYDSLSEEHIPEFGLQMWPGYKLTMQQNDERLLMSFELTPKVLRNDTVIQMLDSYAATKGQNYKRIFEEDIVDKIVWTDYNKKYYRIDEVAWHETPRSRLLIQGKMISLVAYYRKKYNIYILNERQPLLISRTHPRKVRLGCPELVYLVPELCQQTGLTDKMRSNNRLNRILDSHTRAGDDLPLQNVLEMAQIWTKFTVVCKVRDCWLNFKARQLPAETIVLGGDERLRVAWYPDGWGSEMPFTTFLRIGRLPSWVVISTKKIRIQTERYIDLMMRTARKLGFTMPEPSFSFLEENDSLDYYHACEEMIARENPALVMCVLEKQSKPCYRAIKYKCTVDRAVPSQVMLAHNMNTSFVTQAVTTINCKVGGAPWRIQNPLPNTLVIGFTAAQDYFSEDYSYGAMVASMDRYCTRYISLVNVHTCGNELAINLGNNVVTAVRRYQALNDGELPHRIVFYRDSERGGLLPSVYSYENTEIKTRLASIYGVTGYKLAFIVVNRRVNMPKFLDDCCEGVIPPRGTVIDDINIQQDSYAFYLISRTNVPTAYTVFEDNTGIHPDKMEQLTYKLTHSYYNFCNLMCVPAVCQYAHKLANFVANTLNTEPNNDMSDTLYYL